MKKESHLSHAPGQPTGRRSRRLPVLLGVLLPACTWIGSALAEGAAGASVKYPSRLPLARYEYQDPATEVALAKTAADKGIADRASVLTLGKDGYTTSVKGSNGFVCLVQRSWADDFDSPEFWNPDRRMPECWNAAAASSMLPEYLKRTEWVIAGKSTTDMIAATKAAVARHEIGQPAPGAMVYMLSKEQYILPGQGHWYPHVMFIVPATDGSPWGANSPGSPIYSHTSTDEPVTTYFVLAPKWSDGTLGPYSASPPEQEHQHR